MSENDPQTDPQGDPGLGDAGKRAIKAERDRADAAEREVQALKATLKPYVDAGITDPAATKAELDRLTGENSTLSTSLASTSLEVIRLNVGIDKKLPKELIARLKGDDEDSIAADADTLGPYAGVKPTAPAPDPSQGPHGAGGARTTAQQFADSFDF